MSDKCWYAADALEADLTNRHHHVRAASEEEVERRMRRRYPGAVAILVLLEESLRQSLAPSSEADRGRLRRHKDTDEAAVGEVFGGWR